MSRTSAVSLILLALVTGLGIGVFFSQGSREIEPAASVLKAVEALDRDLAAAASITRTVSEQLAGARARIDGLGRTQVMTDTPEGRLLQSLNGIERQLWQQNQTFDRGLSAARTIVRAQRSEIENKVSAYGGIVDRGLTMAGNFAVWLGPTLLFTLLLFVGALVALTNPKVREFLGRSGTLSIWGLTLTLQDVGALRSNIRAWVKQLDLDIRKIYDKNLADTKIVDAFVEVKGGIDELFQGLGVSLKTTPHRANLFVPGFAGDELIQATPYLGTEGMARFGVGRRFSARYGMVGKCWRLRRPLYNPDVSNSDDKLIKDWGLTHSEASRQGQSCRSLLGLPLLETGSGSEPLGVVYVEATGNNVLRAAGSAASQLPVGTADPTSLDDDAYAALIWKNLSATPAMAELIRELKALRTKLIWDDKVIADPGR